jgi:hypothetical protein
MKTKTTNANPIVEKLIKGANGESISILRGFIGVESSSNSRLYLDFSLTSFVDIPSASILHIELSKSPQIPSAVYLKSSTVVQFVKVMTETKTVGSFVHAFPSPNGHLAPAAPMFRRKTIRIGPPGGSGVCADYARAGYYAMKEYEDAMEAGDEQRASDAISEALRITNESISAGCNPWA